MRTSKLPNRARTRPYVRSAASSNGDLPGGGAGDGSNWNASERQTTTAALPAAASSRIISSWTGAELCTPGSYWNHRV